MCANKPKLDTVSFFRCNDCLSVFSLKNVPLWPRPKCACGGGCDWMGNVAQDKLVKLEHRCPCDERCTNARGPSCDCSCGGANHGTKRLVEFTIEVGSVPVARNQPDLAVAEEFRAAKKRAHEAIERKFGANFKAFMTRAPIYERGVSNEIRWALDSYQKAKNYAVHGRRMKALAEIEKQFTIVFAGA